MVQYMSSLSEFTSKLSMKTILHGDHDENNRQMFLHAGKISMVYENGNLRNISIGDCEVIRMIYPAVRDREWLTVYPVISDETFDIHSGTFSIKYTCIYILGSINFSARYSIEGLQDNTIIFSFEGEALSTFEKNRIGFCVLHPVEGYSGNECLIIHHDNSMEKCEFPVYISPHQPFTDITSMNWIVDEIECKLNFFGEIFETEDQRNWTDASYKTYCTPLKLPFPAILHKGDKINQRVELRVITKTLPEKTGNNNVVLTKNIEKTSPFPKIGIGSSSRNKPLSEKEIRILKNLPFDHYRIDLYLFNEDWKIKADIAVNEALRLEYSVEFALFFSDDSERLATEFTRWLLAKKMKPAIICLFHKSFQFTPDSLTDKISRVLKSAFPGVTIACGTNANFAQLNRNRPRSVHADYLCYSIHPQEHASDNTTLTENLQAQHYTVDSARKFANGKGIWVSPVNIQRRFNANAENYKTTTKGDEFPPQVDSRLMSLFGACWTTGSLKYLMESEPKGITFFETVGERGIFQGDHPSRWPSDFQSVEGMIFPLFHIFRFVLKYKSYKVIRSKSSHSLKVDLLYLSDGKRHKIILANFSSEPQEVLIPCNGEYTVKQLNNKTFAEAAQDIDWIENSSGTTIKSEEKVHLAPLSVSFIEV
jgi:D-apionolactonase